MADAQTDITALMGTLKALDQWRSAEVTMQGRGAHRRTDGSLYLQVEYLVEVIVPNHDETKRLLDIVDGKDVAPREVTPVEGAQPLRLWDSEASETVAHDASPQD